MRDENRSSVCIDRGRGDTDYGEHGRSQVLEVAGVDPGDGEADGETND